MSMNSDESAARHYTFYPKGVCSTQIDLDIAEGRVHNIVYKNGCNGNLQALSVLAEGQTVQQLIDKLSGIRCSGGPTSCSDQLARALISVLPEAAEKPGQ